MLLRRRSGPRPRFSSRTLAFEVFVVVLGVTLALGANEVRERWAEAREVRVALEGIAREMQHNCERFGRAQAYHQRLLAEIDSVRAVDPQALEGDNYVEAIPSFRGYNPAFVTTSAYETAQATGALGLMPYERALAIGRYYTFVRLYQENVRQALGVVMQTGEPTLVQTRTIVQITSELQRELAPQSCTGARQLRTELGAEGAEEDEPTQSPPDADAASS